ncbi:group II intron maturase-specific domain-containing protein [Streptomyces sp.]|uniref:group II intron maturase-specific domain-containing protein n=1 Tax=Streptomyces sp. TaxID=1931 RepID=UPI0039C97901
MRSCAAKVKVICWQDVYLPLEVLLHRLNSLVRGWTTYFRPGVSHAAFRYLRAVVWRQVFGWMGRKHRRATWKELRRRYCGGGWWPAGDGAILLDPAKVRTSRYRYRGAAIPTPRPSSA